MGTVLARDSRIASLDQFRGYTVVGMFFVNFVGHFRAVPEIFKHTNTYCSYADTIMPQFFFAVGFAYRLTLLRRLEAEGPGPAYRRALMRNLGLILLGIVIYHLDGSARTWTDLQTLGWSGFLSQAFQREMFQTLVHIGVTAIWIMPVIALPAASRIGFACFSGGLHLWLSNHFYYAWLMKRGVIDGGPLGFLTWTIPMLAGSLAYDVVAEALQSGAPLAKAAWRLVGWGSVVMLAGYLISCLNVWTPPNSVRWPAGASDLLLEPPFVSPSRPVNLWTMCQRSTSLSYLTFSAGFSMALYGLFVAACDVKGLKSGLLATFGTNALAAYIIHMMVSRAIRPYAPPDVPLWYALAAFGLFFAICYVFVRHLEKHRLFLRL